MDPRQTLASGRALLDPVLHPHGFVFDEAHAVAHSSPTFARGAYVRGDRRLELGFRQWLEVVAYQVGDTIITHDAYMRAVLGPVGSNMYPTAVGDPLDGFRYLAHDLACYAGIFLHGSDEHFRRIAERAASSVDARTTLYRADAPR